MVEDPLADAAFTDGLRESVGDEVIKIVSDVKLDLEQDEAEQQEELDRKESATIATADPEASGDELGDLAGPPATSPLATAGDDRAAPEPLSASAATDAHAQSPGIGVKGARNMFGLQVEFTGFTRGVIAFIFIPNPSGSSSSTGTVERRKCGFLHMINEQGLNMTCSQHKNCSCWITARTKPMEAVFEDLVSWLSMSVDESGDRKISEHVHYHQGQRLKAENGMRVKTK